MDTNDLIKLFLEDDKKNPYKNITFKIDSVKYIGYKTIFNLPVLEIDKVLNYNDIYDLFDIPKPKYENLYEFLHYRDVLNNESHTINAIQYITKDINFNEFIISGVLDIKKLFNVVYQHSNSISEDSENSSSEDSENSEQKQYSKPTQINVEFLSFVELFKRIGFISKDKRTNTVADDVLNYIKENYQLSNTDSSNEKTKQTKAYGKNVNLKKIKRVNFDINTIIPKGTSGTIIRYLKLYNPLHELNPKLTKPEFKNILLGSGLVIIKDKKLMFIKEKEIEFSNFIINTFTI